jgi:flavodoxin
MKKSLVVYSSISGFTKKYAEWIAEELGTKALSLSKFDVNSAQSYEIIIYGGNLHAVGING